jgi:hypothetical protein
MVQRPFMLCNLKLESILIKILPQKSPLEKQRLQLFMEHSMCNGKSDFSCTMDVLTIFQVPLRISTFFLSLTVRNPDKKVRIRDP